MKTLLLLLTATIGITAVICGGMMLFSPDGSTLQLSPLLLTGTPFTDFTIPGFVLLFIVGVSNLVATFTLMHRQKNAFSFSLAAGVLICGWIIVQIILTGVYFWLQFVYLGAGISIILISFQLKGKALI
jgi:hypothetical protein